LIINLKDYNYDEIKKYIIDLGEPEYRAKQIFKRLYQGISDFNQMTNVPKQLLYKMKETTEIKSLSISEKYVSKIDGTIKYLYELGDKNIIETVVMKYKHGNTICISTQAGCRMGCSFCASTIGGLFRNLNVSEMVDQVIYSQEDIGERIGNVVLMGIGEPFDNYENVIKFIRNLNEKEGLNIGYRHITISTCGVVPKILELAHENIQVNLSISLHAPNDEIRDEIMPINKKYNVDALLNACREYLKISNRRITFEYSLIKSINDSEKCAKELAKKLHGLLCHVNLIPMNEIKEKNYNTSLHSDIEKFKKVLSNYKIPVTIRRRLGIDINASCGQLRNKKIFQ
jgi:23S rRNA (adenine2503-C2)-methyltransferase